MMGCVSTAEVRVRVKASARREALLPTDDGWIVARVAAPAQEDRANKALCRLVANELGIAPSISIVRGARSRQKLIRVDGMDQAAVNAALRLSHE
jgi:uncharacterized protein YggU (UPF0235/DUF167 family)